MCTYMNVVSACHLHMCMTCSTHTQCLDHSTCQYSVMKWPGNLYNRDQVAVKRERVAVNKVPLYLDGKSCPVDGGVLMSVCPD